MGEVSYSSGRLGWDVIKNHSFAAGLNASSLLIWSWNCCSLHREHLCLQKLEFDTAMAKTEHLPSEIFGGENGHPCPHIPEHVNKICCCFSFLQRAYTEEELNAKLTRRVQKAARRQAKQEELKRLHRAQVLSHNPLIMAHRQLCGKAPWSWHSSEGIRTESSLSTWALLLALSNFMSCIREAKDGWNLSWEFYSEKNNAHNTFLATIMHWIGTGILTKCLMELHLSLLC